MFCLGRQYDAANIKDGGPGTVPNPPFPKTVIPIPYGVGMVMVLDNIVTWAVIEKARPFRTAPVLKAIWV